VIFAHKCIARAAVAEHGNRQLRISQTQAASPIGHRRKNRKDVPLQTAHFRVEWQLAETVNGFARADRI
jgi:hypothetical protein